ncbi:glycosyltransferase family 4 protein [Calothrix sp. FACHB-156]|nr:glycosyltransferase family 4 protein [Calothrix sp. FACHB-156]
MRSIEQQRQEISQDISGKNMIAHCSSFNVGVGGGVETYLAALYQQGLHGVSEQPIKSLVNINQSKFKLLHIHSQDLLLQLKGECPAVFTVHNHSPYCPSGTKYLGNQQVICQRNFSYLGCAWGKIIDGCGSRRPNQAIHEFNTTERTIKFLENSQVTIIANSEYVRKQLIKHGASPEQTVTLRYGIILPKIITAPLSLDIHKNQRILFVGRIVPDKGLEWLLNTLVHTDSQIKLDIAGDGWDRPRLERLANKLGLSQRIVWHGWCNTDKLNHLYQQSFALVFPSVWPEPAGLVTLEAYARYRPVIASQVGGIPEHLRDGETGILVPANDTQKLANAITDLASNYEKSRSMGEQGHTLLMQEFTIAEHVKKLQKIYARTIQNFHA